MWAILLLSFQRFVNLITFKIPIPQWRLTFQTLLRNSVAPRFSSYDFYFGDRGGTWLMTHSVLSVFLPNSGFLDTQQPILRRVRNDFFFPKRPILHNGGLSSQWSARVFQAHPRVRSVSYLQVPSCISWTSSWLSRSPGQQCGFCGAS